MKVTELRFPIRSKFIEACKEAICTHRNDLLAGKKISIHFSQEGYNRCGIATIEPGSDQVFWVDKKCNPTRYGARIRAAAYALYQLGFYGEFEIAHDTGLVTIRRV